MNNSTYVFVFVQGIFLEKNFFIKSTPELSARDIFKTFDNYKKSIPQSLQDRLSAHVWGDYEYDTLQSSGIPLIEVPDIGSLITHCKVLIGH